jgi:creatinine amidohydrolase
MQLKDCTWRDVEAYLKTDYRIVLVLGATEEHADLSVCTDMLIPYAIAQRACELERVLLAPPVPFGISHWSLAYPGTISLKTTTMIALVADIADSLLRQGFRFLTVLNGHGFNRAVAPALGEVAGRYENAVVFFYQWYELPSIKMLCQSKDLVAAHANWVEAAPYTRRSGPRVIPVRIDPMPELLQSPESIRCQLGDGNGPGVLEISTAEYAELEDSLVSDFRFLLRNAYERMRGPAI